MRIAVPKEIMNNENRVALTPGGAQTLVHDGHEVLIETGAGEGASFPDSEYEAAGASIVGTAEDTWAQAELLLKVKEPLESEYQYLRPDLTVFTYLHLAADRPLTEALVDANTTAIAYETVTDRHGTLPLLTPMSQVAGRLAAIEGTHHLLSTQGGRGLLVSGVPGTQPARVVVIGGGQVGASAVAMAHGLRAEVTVLDLKDFDVPLLTSATVPGAANRQYDDERIVRWGETIDGVVVVDGTQPPLAVVVEAVADEATPAQVENAEAVAEAVDDESTAATAPEAEAADADVDGDKADDK